MLSSTPDSTFERKGVLLAAGAGKRLHPMTLTTNKQLLPIYDKPMIYYPLSLFLHAGIRDIMIVVAPGEQANFEKVLGDGSSFGTRISYGTQYTQRGIAEALLVAEEFVGDHPSCLILGDNLLYGEGFAELLRKASRARNGSVIFGYEVPDPRQLGVITFDENGVAVDLEEKPLVPKSNYGIPGIYFFDNEVMRHAKSISPSKRGEFEITDVCRCYLNNKTLKVEVIPKAVTWHDTGSAELLNTASNYVMHKQREENTQIACLEAIAYTYGFINDELLKKAATRFEKTEYGRYLHRLLEGGRVE